MFEKNYKINKNNAVIPILSEIDTTVLLPFCTHLIVLIRFYQEGV